VSITANRGEVVAVMGANGSGKSTLLWSIQGFQKLNTGSVDCKDSVTMVPQRASDLLFLNSLAEELEEADRESGAPSGSTAAIFLKLSNRTDAKQHPRDLSAGQQLALALSVQLVKGANTVLLDEPTRGLDYEAKRHLATTIRELSERGNTFLLASHDVEFVAQISTKIYLLEDGAITLSGSVERLLGYEGELPTQVAKIAQTPGLLLAEQLAVKA
jgi:energy-coupling factor transport system ATP-binding protein